MKTLVEVTMILEVEDERAVMAAAKERNADSEDVEEAVLDLIYSALGDSGVAHLLEPIEASCGLRRKEDPR